MSIANYIEIDGVKIPINDAGIPETKMTISKLEDETSILTQMAEGNLYVVDENFPACNSDGEFLHPYSTYNKTAQVTSLIIEEDQPEASHIAVVYADSRRELIGKAELPMNIRALIKNYKISTWNPPYVSWKTEKTRFTQIDLENKTMKRVWRGIESTSVSLVIAENSEEIVTKYLGETRPSAVACRFITSDGYYLGGVIVSRQTKVDGKTWYMFPYQEGDEYYAVCYDPLNGPQPPTVETVNALYRSGSPVALLEVWIKETIKAEPITFTLRDVSELPAETPEIISVVEACICSGEPIETDDSGGSVVCNTSSSRWETCTTCGTDHMVYANRPVIKAFIKSDIAGTLEDHENRISAIEASLCLQEGTQILMADGTTKNIEDVEYGDMIMTWDIDNNCAIPCKSYGCMFTGYSTGWQHYCFDNGSVLKIQKNHRIYKAEKQIPMLSSKWRLGDHGIAANGELVTFYYAPKELPEAIARRKYALFSETGLYFANDILCGHLLSQPLNANQRTHGRVKLSKEEKATLLEYATARDQEYLVELQYPDYMQEALPHRQKKEKAEMQITKYKKKLSDRDYKTIKASQGKLTDEEIAENIEICDELRLKIRAREELIVTCNEKIQELQTKYGIRIRPLAEIETENIKKAIAKIRDKYTPVVDDNQTEVESTL